MRDNGGTLVDIVPRLLSRIEVQGGVKEDNNIELPLRGIFHIFGASPPPFAPYSPPRICAASPHTHTQNLLLFLALHRTPKLHSDSSALSLGPAPPDQHDRCMHLRGAPRGVLCPARTKSSFTKPIARAKSHRGSIKAAFSSRFQREIYIYRRFNRESFS